MICLGRLRCKRERGRVAMGISSGWLRIAGLFAAAALLGAAGKVETETIITSSKPGEASLRYEAGPQSQAIDMGTAVHIVVKLTNEGTEPITLIWGDFSYDAVYRFDIECNGKKIRSLNKYPLPPLNRIQPKFIKTLAPGDRADRVVDMSFFGGGSYQLREPGTYTFKPSFTAITVERTGSGQEFREIRRETIEAAPFTLTIRGTPLMEASSGFGRVKISGKVVDAAGAPIPTAKVSFGSLEKMVDPNGEFVFERLPDAMPLLKLTATAPGYPVIKKEIINQPPRKDYRQQFTLDKSAAVTARGMVVDENGRPLEGVQVTYYNEGVMVGAYASVVAYTDKSGRFELPGITPAGDRIRLSVSTDRHMQNFAATLKEALSGAWKLVLPSVAAMTVTGHAYFADGKPAAGRNIRIVKKGIPYDNSIQPDKTDAAGAFSIRMHSTDPFVATAILENPVEGNSYKIPHGYWQAEAGTVSPGQKGLKLVFDKRGRIDVVLKPAGKLPAGNEFKIDCDYLELGKSNPVPVATRTISASQLTASFDSLSSGTYTIRVTELGKLGRYWTSTVPLAATGDFHATHTVRIPKNEVGTIRARIVGQDESTPIRGGNVTVSVPGRQDQFIFRNGVFEVADIPAGEASLAVYSGGYELCHATGVVRADAVSDFGTIVLLPQENRTGWVGGRVLYDDGTPALGACFRDGYQIRSVDGNGFYRKEVYAGRSVVEIGLAGVPRFPHPGERGIHFLDRNEALMVQPVCAIMDVKPGETVKHDFVIPTKNFRG